MDDSKLYVFAASFIGTLFGVYYAVSLNPLNNYLIFTALFALIGAGLANAVLLLVVKVYDWLKRYFAENERTQPVQTSALNLS